MVLTPVFNMIRVLLCHLCCSPWCPSINMDSPITFVLHNYHIKKSLCWLDTTQLSSQVVRQHLSLLHTGLAFMPLPNFESNRLWILVLAISIITCEIYKYFGSFLLLPECFPCFGKSSYSAIWDVLEHLSSWASRINPHIYSCSIKLCDIMFYYK